MKHEIKPEIARVLNLYKLTVESEFIPLSKSRMAGEKHPSLNWKVTLKQDGRPIVTTLYTAGSAHCPSYKPNDRSREQYYTIKKECEVGYKCSYSYSSDVVCPHYSEHHKITPNSVDVIYSLMLDSEVSQYESFEEWADCFGYDQDSRTAEKIYRDCLAIAARFNGGLSSTIRDALKEAFQGY